MPAAQKLGVWAMPQPATDIQESPWMPVVSAFFGALRDANSKTAFDYDEIEVWRDNWANSQCMNLKEAPPWFNLGDLFWRLPKASTPKPPH